MEKTKPRATQSTKQKARKAEEKALAPDTSRFYKKEKHGLRCLTCAHNCLIANGQRGFCGVRKNVNGVLKVLNYGKIVACNIDPIEKKPLYHFLPASFSLSIASVGCNFKCLNCQNHDIAIELREKEPIPGNFVEPEKIVEIAIANNLPSISYTYTEPTVFLEYCLDVMKLAKKHGIKNVFVSNGFMSEQSRKAIAKYLDAINIDIKGFSDEFYRKVCNGRLQPVLDTCKFLKEKGVWLEITTLVIPTLNDSDDVFESIAGFIAKQLGKETPWHISQFCGSISWKLKHIPDTPLTTLERAIAIGRKHLKYVYIGNIPGHEAENTYCKKCGSIVIRRYGYSVKRLDVDGKCPNCKEKIDLIL
jgi:pyruvate formate lyase activating enzyme